MHTPPASSPPAARYQPPRFADDGVRQEELSEAVMALFGRLPEAATDHDRYAWTAWATAACAELCWLIWIVRRRHRGDRLPDGRSRRSANWPGVMAWASAFLGLTQIAVTDADPLAFAVVAGLCLQCGRLLGRPERIGRRFPPCVAPAARASAPPTGRGRAGRPVGATAGYNRRRRRKRARSGRTPSASRRRVRRAGLRRHPLNYPVRRRRRRPSPGQQADGSGP
jgi:hypothetical protein